MAITEIQDRRLTALLQELEPKAKDLPERARGFVLDQVKRHDQYGDRIFMSPAQWRWLEDLYQKNVGPLDELPSEKDGGRDDEGTDRRFGAPPGERPEEGDDDIPF